MKYEATSRSSSIWPPQLPQTSRLPPPPLLPPPAAPLPPSCPISSYSSCCCSCSSTSYFIHLLLLSFLFSSSHSSSSSHLFSSSPPLPQLTQLLLCLLFLLLLFHHSLPLLLPFQSAGSNRDEGKSGNNLPPLVFSQLAQKCLILYFQRQTKVFLKLCCWPQVGGDFGCKVTSCEGGFPALTHQRALSLVLVFIY